MKKKIQNWILVFTGIFIFNLSCKKEDEPDTMIETKSFSGEVVTKWLDRQLEMLRVPLPAGVGSQAAERCQAYCGIATYESVVPGMPDYQSLSGQLTDFPVMPTTDPTMDYHWAASANAALAEMNKNLFPLASAENKTNIDKLEDSLEAIYAGEVDAATLQRSIAFGKEVAAKVFAWAATDGSANVNPPYVAPVGPGLWVPTATTPAINPYASQRRLLVPGVVTGTDLAPPPTYSADPASPFYAMVKDVYDKSLVLTDDQKAMAIYYRDAPGYPGGGAFISIFAQVLTKAQPTLDIAAESYAKVGLAQSDATIILFTSKYNYKLVRPVTYIRNEMGHPTWNTFIPTPNHPEFPSGHAVTNSSVLRMLTDVFGDNFQITLHTYDYLGLAPRSFNSFYQMGDEMSNSRVFGGLHYQATCDKSLVQGKKVAQNILDKIKFKK
jgi:hypothetical protein